MAHGDRPLARQAPEVDGLQRFVRPCTLAPGTHADSLGGGDAGADLAPYVADSLPATAQVRHDFCLSPVGIFLTV